MFLFPAHSTSSPSSSKAVDSNQDGDVKPSSSQGAAVSALDWLRNESYADVPQKQQLAVVTVSSSSSEDDSFEIVSSEDEDEVATKRLRLDEQSVLQRSAEASSKTQTKAPLGALFLEDLSIPTMGRLHDDQRPQAFRSDRNKNTALLNYGSIFEGHLSRYSCLFPFSVLCRKTRRHATGVITLKNGNLLQGKCREKLKEPRYYSRSQMKRLQKFSSFNDVTKKSPLPITALPLVIKLAPKPDFQDRNVIKSCISNTATEDTPYDELKKAVVRQRTEEFNRRLNSDAKNIQLWLDFIDFQNDVARYSDSAMTESALLEKKLAIIDRALTSNPGNIKLLVEKIKLKGTSASNQNAIAEEWRNIAFIHPNNAEVWWECIMATCRRFSAFSFDKLLLTFSKCLSTMSDILDGTIKSHRPVPNMEELMIYLFIALVYILREAGYTERALVLFQCQIELSLFPPSHVVEMQRQKAIDELELYFSTGLPLFGQPGAHGWLKWQPSTTANSEESSESNRQAQLEEEDEIDRLVMANAPAGSSKSALWAFLEESRTARRVVPLPQTAPASDDPERQVLFEDVSRFLVKIKSLENKHRLLLMFFEFFGVDVISCGTLDTFIKMDSFSTSFTARTMALPLFRMRQNRELSEYQPKLISYNAMMSLEMINLAYTQAVGLLAEPFRTHLICVYVKQEMASYLTAVASETDLNNKPSPALDKRARQVKAVIRDILREPANRNNLAVWALCSECEMRLGRNSREAVRIAETAINVSHNLKLYASWGALCHLATQTGFYSFGFVPDLEVFDISRITLATDSSSRSARLLASCLLKKTIPESFDLLKLRNEVSSQIADFLRFGDIEDDDNDEQQQLMPVQPLLCQIAECYSLFLYLVENTLSASSSDVGLSSSDAVFISLLGQVDSAVKKLSLNPFSPLKRYVDQVSIRLHSSRIALVSFDYRTNIKPISHLRDVVLAAASAFPNSWVFLRCLIEIREPAFLSSTLLKFVRSVSHRIVHPLAWIEILSGLLSKIEKVNDTFASSSSSGGVNLLRSFFEKAVESSLLSSRSSALWALYIAFEESRARVACVATSRRLEGVLYRALQACPWSKEMYLSMARCRPEDKLQDAVDMIIEKGLRLHTLVDELDTFQTSTP